MFYIGFNNIYLLYSYFDKLEKIDFILNEKVSVIDKQFDDTVMDEVREFFKAKGVEVSISSQDQFTLKQ